MSPLIRNQSRLLRPFGPGRSGHVIYSTGRKGGTMSIVMWPDHLLTLDEWDALPEDESRRCELAEGVLIVSPRPFARHQRAVWRLAAQLEPQLPPGFVVVTDVDVTIDASHPATVRAPDVVVLPTPAIGGARARYGAGDVALAVEIVSEGSVRTDRVSKMFEYAEAGIPNYWVIDLDAPVTLDAYGLVDGKYEPLASSDGVVALSSPVSVTIDLPALVTPR
jgi:Uma2 family endonuclease